MNLLFWNLAKNENSKVLKEIIIEKAIDIIILSEFQSTNLTLVVSGLNGEFCLHQGFGACEKVILLARKTVEIIVRREQNRYALYACNFDGRSYIIAGIHLPANPSADAELRKNVIRDLIKDICTLETELKNSNTIVIGDFNASPFDDELIQKDAFNAVLYKELIKKTEYVKINGKQYRRFYNPMVNFVSEDSLNYGSFYYSNGMKTLYWFCYDQVIVRKPLINVISSIQYCKKVNNRSLLNKFMPNGNISDHLPLMVKFERMAQHE